VVGLGRDEMGWRTLVGMTPGGGVRRQAGGDAAFLAFAPARRTGPNTADAGASAWGTGGPRRQ
jgi:hypothetical protein